MVAVFNGSLMSYLVLLQDWTGAITHTQTKAGSNEMQRQTQNHEQTLSVYLDLDVMDDSKQSKPGALDHHKAPPVCTHSRWWPVARGSGRHNNAARCYRKTERAQWQSSTFAMSEKIAHPPARIRLLSLLPGRGRTSIYLGLMYLNFYLPLFNTLILTYLQHSELWEGRRALLVFPCVCVCVHEHTHLYLEKQMDSCCRVSFLLCLFIFISC